MTTLYVQELHKFSSLIRQTIGLATLYVAGIIQVLFFNKTEAIGLATLYVAGIIQVFFFNL